MSLTTLTAEELWSISIDSLNAHCTLIHTIVQQRLHPKNGDIRFDGARYIDVPYSDIQSPLRTGYQGPGWYLNGKKVG